MSFAYLERTFQDKLSQLPPDEDLRIVSERSSAFKFDYDTKKTPHEKAKIAQDWKTAMKSMFQVKSEWTSNPRNTQLVSEIFKLLT